MARHTAEWLRNWRQMTWAQRRDSAPMNILYWITGLAIVAAPVLVLIFKD